MKFARGFYKWLEGCWLVPEYVYELVGVGLCKFFTIHSTVCRGRRDHVVAGKVIDWPERWI